MMFLIDQLIRATQEYGQLRAQLSATEAERNELARLLAASRRATENAERQLRMEQDAGAQDRQDVRLARAQRDAARHEAGLLSEEVARLTRNNESLRTAVIALGGAVVEL